MANSTTRALALAAELNKGIGTSFGKLSGIFRTAFSLSITRGGLSLALGRVARTLTPTYDAIVEQVRSAPVVAADETGWKVGRWWDAKALRMADAIERSIVRLHLESQGEFVAIMNGIAMHIESQKTVPEVARLLGESLRTLAAARGFEEHHQRRLDQRLAELFQRVRTTS